MIFEVLAPQLKWLTRHDESLPIISEENGGKTQEQLERESYKFTWVGIAFLK
ncbi:hypothetical protein [Nitrospira sp. Nam74]